MTVYSRHQIGFTSSTLLALVVAGILLGASLAYFSKFSQPPQTLDESAKTSIESPQTAHRTPAKHRPINNVPQATQHTNASSAPQRALKKNAAFVRQTQTANQSTNSSFNGLPNESFSTENTSGPNYGVVNTPRSNSAQFSTTSKSSETAETEFFDNQPDATGSIHGRVLLSNGRPAKGAVVSAQFLDTSQAASGLAGSNRKSLTTKANGQFRLNGLLPGRYRIRARFNEEYSTDSIDAVSGSDNVDLILNRITTVYVTGRVLDYQNQPIEGATATLKSAAATAFTDANGIFEMTTQVEKDSYYHFLVEKDGFTDGHVAAPAAKLLSFGESSLLEVRMKSVQDRTRVTGVVRDDNGNQLANQRVNLHSRSSGSYSARTDASGAFIIEEVPVANDYRLAVIPNSAYQRFSQTRIDLNQINFFEVVLQTVTEFSTLAGRLVDPSGNPIPAFTLNVNSLSGGTLNATVQTDQSGGFLLQNIPAGKVYIRSSGSPDFLVPNVTLPVGEIREIDIPLDWGDQGLNGVVVTDIGKPLSGAKVQVFWSGNVAGAAGNRTLRTAYTDNQGQFAFSNLGGGSRSLSLSLSGYKSAKHVVDVTSSQPVQLLMERSW